MLNPSHVTQGARIVALVILVVLHILVLPILVSVPPAQTLPPIAQAKAFKTVVEMLVQQSLALKFATQALPLVLAIQEILLTLSLGLGQNLYTTLIPMDIGELPPSINYLILLET